MVASMNGASSRSSRRCANIDAERESADTGPEPATSAAPPSAVRPTKVRRLMRLDSMRSTEPPTRGCGSRQNGKRRTPPRRSRRLRPLLRRTSGNVGGPSETLGTHLALGNQASGRLSYPSGFAQLARERDEQLLGQV